MQEVNMVKKKGLGSIDLIKEAVLYGTKGSGVTNSTGPDGALAYSFNGTSNAYFEFPSSKKSLFDFINKPFELEMVLWLNSTAVMQPLGNLLNGSGSSDYAMTLNNTFQTVCKFSLDGMESSLTKRLRFGTGTEKLPIGRWVNLKLTRLADKGTIQFLIDDVLISFFSNITSFNNVQTNLFRIGTSFDGAYPLNGILAKMTVKPL